MNEILSVNNTATSLSLRTSMGMYNATNQNSHFCPVSHFVNYYLEGFCTPVANYVYQMVRPEHLHDLQYGIRLINKQVVPYQTYRDELSKMETKAQKVGASLLAPCNLIRAQTKGTAGRGIEVVVNQSLKLLFCLLPQTIKNYIATFERALDFVEKLIKSYFHETREVGFNFLKVYQTLGIAEQYRHKNLIVSEYQINDPNLFRNLLLNQGFTEETIQHSYDLAADAYDRSNQLFGNEDHVQFSSEYKALMKDILYFPPSFQQVPQMMEKFLHRLENRLKAIHKLGITDSSYIMGVAAWAHQEIVKIHPFEDGNGRIARLIMNAILKYFNLNPVIFLSDKEYVDAIKKDIKTPGAFAHFLIHNATLEMQNNVNLLSWEDQPSILQRIAEWEQRAYTDKQLN